MRDLKGDTRTQRCKQRDRREKRMSSKKMIPRAEWRQKRNEQKMKIIKS